jgi:hypothetical protein
MCTFVKTSDLNILIDPSVALGPRRYGLPPHEIEIKRMTELMVDIRKHIEVSDLVVITHYHYDHHNPDDARLLAEKKVLLKHPKDKINRSQAERAAFFLERLREVEADVEFADGRSYDFDGVHVSVSSPVYHGANPRLGFVLEVFIEDGDTFLFSSDVEGPIHREQLNFMLESDAETVFVDGPMTYMLGYRFSAKSFESSIQNLIELIDKTNVKRIVVDHHLTRDLDYRKKIDSVIRRGEEAGTEVLSAAEFLGKEDLLLEARRKELYSKKT